MGEWKEYKLGEVLTFQRGYDLPKSEMNGGDIPVAGSNGVIGYHNQYTTKGPGITIGRSGNIGIPKFYKDNFWAHNTVLYVKDFHGSDERFMYYFLQTVDFTQFNTGSAVPSLNRNHIHELRVFIPPLSEQKRIASILRSLDDKIDLLQRENKTLEAMAETLFNKTLSDKENDGTIEQFVSIQNGYAFKSKDFQEHGINGVIKIKNISGGVIDINKTDCIDSNIVQGISPKFKVHTGDILIAMTGAEIGKLGIIPSTNKNLWLNQRVGMLAERYPGAKYIAYLQLKSDYGLDYVENTATGSAQPNISSSAIENCGFPLLDVSAIKALAYQLEGLYEKIIHNLGHINGLELLRNELLIQLMDNTNL
ncbi:MAG TPA: restriction endonuclease subunit S [Bacteroidetes bacterium]|nr:restriction endonuclease subunit S [Candidatus Limimorpha avicola]